jgi:hypothetical protein
LDLPSKVYVRRKVEMTTEQRKLYVQMKEFALAQLANGKVATTVNVLTQIMRLQQIACGHFQPDDEAPIESIKNNRLDELLSVCEENSGKSIIWATWTHDIKAIEAAWPRHTGKILWLLTTEQHPRKSVKKLSGAFKTLMTLFGFLLVSLQQAAMALR